MSEPVGTVGVMLVTFEGPEGAGKSTVIRAVSDRLADRGIRLIATREPGAGEFGKKIRALLLEGESVEPKAELFLFLADRANHVTTIIKPALDSGALVLCDRFSDSTAVYQGVARGMDRIQIAQLNDFATGGLKPDMTFLFDLEPEAGLSRLVSQDRLDREPLEFHLKVRAGFLELARQDPERWVVIDASQSVERVVNQVMQILETRAIRRSGA